MNKPLQVLLAVLSALALVSSVRAQEQQVPFSGFGRFDGLNVQILDPWTNANITHTIALSSSDTLVRGTQ